MRRIFFILAVLFPLWGHTCIIEAYPKYIRTGEVGKSIVDTIIKSSTCENKVKRKFYSLLSSSTGAISKTHFQRIMGKDISVKISPQKIEIVELEDILKNSYPLRKNWSFQKTHFSGQQQLFPYDNSERVQINCQNCENVGSKTFQVYFHDILRGKKRVVWGNTRVVIQTRSLVALRTLRANIPLKPEDFKEQLSYTTGLENLFFTNKKNLAFYKSNRNLKEGLPLKASDVSSLNLVSSGRPVKIFIEGKGMSLTSMALPLRSGKLGETIQLKSIKGDKNIIGKIVDFNKVKIDL